MRVRSHADIPDGGPPRQSRARHLPDARAWASSSGASGSGRFRLGNVVGTLLAGVLIGQLDIQVDPVVKIVFFDLFLFATGYKVGPQFIRGLGKSALPQVALTVVLCVTSLVITVAAAKIFRYDCGTAAGLMAGAFTESTVIGTAGETINRLDLPAAEKKRLLNNIPVAYAVSLPGRHGLRRVVPVEPRAAAPQGGPEGGEPQARGGARGRAEASRRRQSAYREWDLRAYRLDDARVGRPERGGSREVLRARAGLRRADPPRRGDSRRRRRRPCSRRGDAVAIAARRRVLAGGIPVGVEIEDRALLDFPIVALDVVVTNRSVVDRHLAELAETHGRGVALLEARPRRRGDPVGALDRWSIAATSCGSRARPADVERAGKALGYIERPSQRDRRRLRRPRHRRRRARRAPLGHGRRPAAQPDGERRRAHHGPRLRLAAVGAADVRPDPGARALGLRHGRPGGLHRRRRPDAPARASSRGSSRRGRACSSSASSSRSRRTSRRSSSAGTS